MGRLSLLAAPAPRFGALLALGALLFAGPAAAQAPDPYVTSGEDTGGSDAASRLDALDDDLAAQPTQAELDAQKAVEEAIAGAKNKPVAEPALQAEPAPAAAAAAAAGDEKKKRKSDPKRQRFIEGELANVGTIGLIPWENRFGITIGVERLGEIFYGSLTPQINFTTDVYDRPLSMSFGIPLRVEVLDSRADVRFDNAGRFRTEDWDEPSDFAKIIRQITYGGKEERFYLDINAFKASSIGHGTIVKRFNPNLNLNTTRVSFSFDAFMDYAGFETYLSDVTGPDVMGALAFIKPLSLIDRDNYVLRSFSIGFAFAADVDAPLRNAVDVDDIDNDGRRERELRIDQDNFQPQYLSTEVVAYGIDVEIKIVDTAVLDYKPYLDWSFLESGVPTNVLPGQETQTDRAAVSTRAVRSSGITFGHLFRINVGEGDVHALRLRAEYRNYEPNYLPSYFDVLYEIQRVQYSPGTNDPDDLANNTKLQQVLGRDPDGDRIHGMYLETSWLYSHYLALAFGLELNSKTNDNNLFFHVEVPHIGRWQFVATYHKRLAKSFADLFNFDFGEADVFILKTRYGLADWMHVNFEMLTPFGIGPESLFRNTIQWNLSAEFGFSY